MNKWIMASSRQIQLASGRSESWMRAYALGKKAGKMAGALSSALPSECIVMRDRSIVFRESRLKDSDRCTALGDGSVALGDGGVA